MQILYWRDIPSVIQAFGEDGTPVKRELPAWYQQEIDRVAMAEGLIGSDEYLAEWKWGPEQERQGSVQEVADALVAELEAQWEARERERGA